MTVFWKEANTTQVFDILTPLYGAHIHVRASLLEALRERVRDTHQCSEVDVANLAVCYTLGFGAQKNEPESARLRSKLSADIQESIQQGLENFRTTYRYTRYEDSLFRKCLDLGHVDSIDLTEVPTNPDNAVNIKRDCLNELEDTAKVLGGQHHIVCTLRANLASLYFIRGMLKEATEEQRLLLSVYREKYGEGSRHTQSAKVNLATTYHEAGHYREAEILLHDVLTVRTANLGVDHMDTLRTRSDLATMYLARGKWAEAEKLLHEVVRSSIAVLTPTHPHSIVHLGNLASALQNNDKLEEAQIEQQRALDASIRLYGQRHRGTIICISNMMSIYNDRHLLDDEGDNFLQQAEESADIAVNILGDTDPLSLKIRSIIAHAYIQRGRYDEAHKKANHVYEVFRENSGEENVDTLTTLGTLAQIHFLRHEWQLAEQRYLQILDGIEGNEHCDYAVILGNLAAVYFQQGEYAKAADCAKRAYEHQLTQCEETHRLTVLVREKFERYQALANAPTV
jgi:tetratricopeptide (TPR) repeat protein